MAPVQLGHFNSFQDKVCPVQVSANPVHSEALCHCHSTVKNLPRNCSFLMCLLRHACITGWQRKLVLTTVLSLPFLWALQILSWLVSDQYMRSVTVSKSKATMLRPSRTSEWTTLGWEVMSSCTIWFRLATSKKAWRESVKRHRISLICFPCPFFR